jgi:hypothetical protein
MARKPKVETPEEVPAEEKVETPKVCPNCNNSGKFCSECSSREVVN